MEKGVHPYGMQTFQMAIARLLQDKAIDETTAADALGG
jgi:hypothetical protein